MDRVILHSDINCFYASVEHLEHPEYAGQPLAVGGSVEMRHGIILTADYMSRAYGVRTGMTIPEARRICPGIVILSPRMETYKDFSRMAHSIYSDYSDKIESFGIDEAWIDVSKCCKDIGQGETIAKEINSRMKKELGITNSVGVSWNKIFAKLGSDYKKPDAVTVFSRDRMDIIRKLPAKDLLFVGKSTNRRLESLGIYTIGHIADTPVDILKSQLGKTGETLHRYALGLDDSPVINDELKEERKSIGNSTTTSRDYYNDEDVKIIIFSLAESVARRLKEHGLKGSVVEMSVRDNTLKSYVRQTNIYKKTNISDEIAAAAFDLFKASYSWEHPVRSLGVRVSDLVPANEPEQLTLFDDMEERSKRQKMDSAVDSIRSKFGTDIIKRGLMYTDETLTKRPDYKK